MQGELKSTKELLEQKMNEAGQEKEAWIAERRRLVEDVQAKEVELHGLHLQLEAKPQGNKYRKKKYTFVLILKFSG